MDQHDIYEKYGLPRDYVSCPSCGKIYGHHNTKSCSVCSECSKCCDCRNPEMVKAEELIDILYGPLA